MAERSIAGRHSRFSRADRPASPCLLLCACSWRDYIKAVSTYLAFVITALALASFSACSSSPEQEGSSEYIDDAIITTWVKAAILSEPALNVNEIHVETFKGMVQLSGFVSAKATADRAVELASGVSGVKSVNSDMRLK